MKIYEIDEEIRTLLDGSIGEDGVVDEDLMARLDVLSSDRDNKILSFGKYLKERKAEIAAIKNAEKGMADRRKSLEKKHLKSEEYLLSLIDLPVYDSEITVSKRRSERLGFDDEPQFIRSHYKHDGVIAKKTVESVNKSLVKDMIKNGATFEGVHIEEHYSLQIK